MRPLKRKWRPPMALAVLVVCASLLAVPLLAVLALQIGTNWFVHETESSLIKQAAIYAGAYAEAFEAEAKAGGEPVPGYYLPPGKRVFWNAEVRTFRSFLNLRSDEIEPARPDAVPVEDDFDRRYLPVARALGAIEQRAARATLSGVTFLDFQGLDLLDDRPMSFAAVPEVEKALRGEIGAVLRWRSDADARWSFLSLVRGAGFRVLVAYPVITLNRVVGVVYISRTPVRFESYLFEEGVAFLALICATLLGALMMGAFLVRMVLRPLQALRDQSRLVARGAHDDLAPLEYHGIREIAELGEAVMTMSASLSRRTKEIGIYTNHVTHELKSPVTAILGATELLQEGDLPGDVQHKLVRAITGQGARMATLLDQLREIARWRQNAPGEPGLLRSMVPTVPGLQIALSNSEAVLPLSVVHGQTILIHLAQNACHNGADRIDLDWNGGVLRVSDNGRGFADVDLARLSEPFFTTRRDAGGTGLGLAIVVSILDLYDAAFIPIRREGGAMFEIVFSPTSICTKPALKMHNSRGEVAQAQD